MSGFITYCFSDWQSERFERGRAHIVNGVRTDNPIRRPLRKNELEGIDYYVKADPDFTTGTYGVCHRKLRQIIQPGDILFFRTLWRKEQYLIGFFSIEGKCGEDENPILCANLQSSRLIHFSLPITFDLAKQINPKTKFRDGVHPNCSINGRLGRNFKRIDNATTNMLLTLVEKAKTKAAA